MNIFDPKKKGFKQTSMELYILGAFLFVGIGMVLSLLGSGGAILTIPVLVYVFGINPYWATSYSLFIMGLSNWAATVDNIRKKAIYYKIGLYFAIPALGVTFFIRRFILPAIPSVLFENETMLISKGSVILFVFSFLIFLTAIRTLRDTSVEKHQALRISPLRNVFQGAGIGLVTGFVGAGGGFLIVPALAFGAKVPMREAIATSLFIISITTSLGFLGDLNPEVYMDWPFLLYCAACSILGVVIANPLKNKFTNRGLKLIFGYFILGLSLFVFLIELYKIGVG